MKADGSLWHLLALDLIVVSALLFTMPQAKFVHGIYPVRCARERPMATNRRKET